MAWGMSAAFKTNSNHFRRAKKMVAALGASATFNIEKTLSRQAEPAEP
jgi:hypothetical protein